MNAKISTNKIRKILEERLKRHKPYFSPANCSQNVRSHSETLNETLNIAWSTEYRYPSQCPPPPPPP